MSAPQLTSNPAAARAWREQYAREHPEDPRHGTSISMYRYWGCRCDRCRDLRRQVDNRSDQRDSPHLGTVYRIQEHRAFGEPLCPSCERYLAVFRG